MATTEHPALPDLAHIRMSTAHEIDDVKALAKLVIEIFSEKTDLSRQQSAEVFLTALILHALCKLKINNPLMLLSNVEDLLAYFDSNSSLFMDLARFNHADEEINMMVGTAVADMLERSPKERHSIVSMIASALATFPWLNVPSDLNDSIQDELIAFQEKLIDALIPGFQVEFTPDEAIKAGACFEDALSEEDALSSTPDLLDAISEGRKPDTLH